MSSGSSSPRPVAAAPALMRARSSSLGTVSLASHSSGLSAGACGSTAQCELVRSSPMGMYSIKRRWMGRSTVKRARAATSWLSRRTTTQLTLTGSKPQASAASMPAMVCSSRPRRVIFPKSVGSSVSSEMLTRLRPASLSCGANLGSRAPLVVSEMSSICGIARMSRISGMIRRLTSGSPPVRRTRRMPSPATKRTKRAISSALSSSSCARGATPSAGMQ